MKRQELMSFEAELQSFGEGLSETANHGLKLGLICLSEFKKTVTGLLRVLFVPPRLGRRLDPGRMDDGEKILFDQQKSTHPPNFNLLK